jgi:hypothetical protein
VETSISKSSIFEYSHFISEKIMHYVLPNVGEKFQPEFGYCWKWGALAAEFKGGNFF